VVGWNTGVNAEMIQAAQSAFGVVVVSRQPGHIQPAIVIVMRTRLAGDESVGANPEFRQGLQIALVSS
jgi:hypothetical protein